MSSCGLKVFKESNLISTRSAPLDFAFAKLANIWSTESAIIGAHINVVFFRVLLPSILKDVGEGVSCMGKPNTRLNYQTFHFLVSHENKDKHL